MVLPRQAWHTALPDNQRVLRSRLKSGRLGYSGSYAVVCHSHCLGSWLTAVHRTTMRYFVRHHHPES